MDLLQFHKMRTAVQHNAYPGSVGDVASMETELRDLLMATGLFEDVEVEKTGDPDQLVIGLCTYAPDFSEDDVATAIERLWDDRVRYPFWEAHSLLVDQGHVEFEAATRNSDSGHYVTVHMVAQKARIPMQRMPAD